MSETVLVTEPEFRKGEAVFRAVRDVVLRPAPPDESALAEAVRASASRATILGPIRYVGPLYDALAEAAAGRGALLARFGVGHDGVDKPLAASRGIVVTNTPGVLDDSVAEHAIGLLLALARRTGRLDAKVRRGEFPAEPGCEVRGKTLAVVGFGPIGRRAAVAAHFGLGMRVLAVGRRSREELARDEGRPAEQIEAEFGLARYGNDVDAALGEADFVSIHIPASAATDRFFNAARLARIKPGAFLINTARGVVLDEDALYDALASGRLAGAAIDVFRVEPYAPQSPDKDLRALDNVLLTPHVGSCTREANERMAHASLANVRAFLAGCMADLSRVG